MTNDLVYVLHQTILFNRIHVDFQELEFQLKTHPTYPSLHALTGVLDHFQMDHMAIEVPVDSEVLDYLPLVFITPLEISASSGLAFIEKKGNQFKVHFSKKDAYPLTKSEFLAAFNGVVLGLDPAEDTPTVSHRFHYVVQSIILWLLLVFPFVFSFDIEQTAILLISAIGVIVSYSIVKEELGLSSEIGNALCGPSHPKIDCNTIIKSSNLSLLGLKLGDWSLIYFTGIFWIHLLGTVSGLEQSLVFWLSLITLPITLFSIYYQAFIARKWCTLCLTIVGLMWLQVGVHWTFGELQSITWEELGIGIPIAITLAGLGMLIKPQLEKHFQMKEEYFQLSRFKKDFTLFKHLLDSSPFHDTTIEGCREIQLGNEHAPLSIHLLTNPLCGHCRATHELSEKLLSQYKNQISITIRYNVNYSNSLSDSVQIATRLLEIFHTSAYEVFKKAMHEIYNGTQESKWLEKWGKTIAFENYFKTLKEEYAWCHEHQLNFTPVILINGHEYPKAYASKDLMEFIEDLIDVYEPVFV